MAMVDTKHAPDGDYSPGMDAKTHEATYRGFVTFAEIGSAVVICWVLALAVGGIKHAWRRPPSRFCSPCCCSSTRPSRWESDPTRSA